MGLNNNMFMRYHIIEMINWSFLLKQEGYGGQWNFIDLPYPFVLMCIAKEWCCGNYRRTTSYM